MSGDSSGTWHTLLCCSVYEACHPYIVMQVIYALLALGDTAAEDGIMESGIAIRCLDLFTQFPFNNLLHHRVRSCDIASLPLLALCCADYQHIIKDHVQSAASFGIRSGCLSVCCMCCVCLHVSVIACSIFSHVS